MVRESQAAFDGDVQQFGHLPVSRSLTAFVEQIASVVHAANESEAEQRLSVAMLVMMANRDNFTARAEPEVSHVDRTASL